MGSVFSCLASSFMYLGEFLENLFLALGEIGAVLTRGIIGIIVGLCDVLAATSCCCRVPWSDRPDRSTYTFAATQTTNAVVTESPLATIGGKHVLASVFTKEGREQRQEIKAAKKKAAELKAEEDAVVRSAKKEEEVKKKKAEVEAAKKAAKEEKEKAALQAMEEKSAATPKAY